MPVVNDNFEPGEPFNGDHFLEKEFIKLRDKFNIKTVIETGTNCGDSTIWLANNFERVITTEIHEGYFAIAQARLSEFNNVETYLLNSGKELKNVIPNEICLFFLDAHWQEYNPLLDELKQIAEAGIKPVIAIHDFKVPGKDFGWDNYHNISYQWSSVENHIKAIYGEEFEYYYNKEAAGMKRGCVFILPK